MTPPMIISYDGTANDGDALAFGRVLAAAGASVALAYVRHGREDDLAAELRAERAAEQILEQGARALGLPDAARHVILHGSTGEGLRELCERERAEVVVFGSDYRTPVGGVRPGTSAQRLLSGGPAAVAIAPARLAASGPAGIRRIGVLADGADGVDLGPAETAGSLARQTGAAIVDARDGALDLLVVGSRPEAETGRVMLSALSEYAVELSRCPVLVVPRGKGLDFRPELVTA